MTGDRFARQFDDVETALTTVDHAVHGDAVSWEEQHPVTGHQLGAGHHLFTAIAAQAAHVGLKAGQKVGIGRVGDALGGVANRFAALDHADHQGRAHKEALQAVQRHSQGVEKVDVDLAFLLEARPGAFETEVCRNQDEAGDRQGGQGQRAGQQRQGQ